MLHRTGTRKLHTAKQLNPTHARDLEDTARNANAAAASNGAEKVNIGITIFAHHLTQMNWTCNAEWEWEGGCHYEASIDGDGWHHHQQQWPYFWRLHDKEVHFIAATTATGD